jgi:hypothetical protein
LVTLRFKDAALLYVRFAALIAIGPLLAVACAFIGQQLAIATHPHPKHTDALYDLGIGDPTNSVLGFSFGMVVGYVVAAIYEGALLVWAAAWVFRRAVWYYRNTDRYGLPLD